LHLRAYEAALVLALIVVVGVCDVVGDGVGGGVGGAVALGSVGIGVNVGHVLFLLSMAVLVLVVVRYAVVNKKGWSYYEKNKLVSERLSESSLCTVTYRSMKTNLPSASLSGVMPWSASEVFGSRIVLLW
jgi:hypothetical protein